MSTLPMLTLFGAYNYDPTIFDNITFPDGIDAELFKDKLLLSKGEMPLLYSSIPFNKAAFGVWSKTWAESFRRLLTAFTEEYDPLHNYDRREEYSDTEKKENSGKESGTSKTTGHTTGTAETGSGTTREEKVSAYNEDDYQPDRMAEDSISSTEERSTNTVDDVESSVDRSATEDRTLTHSAHLYGNIGVTRSQEMLLDELRLRSNNNLYDAIVEIFSKEFLIGVY